MKQVESLQSVVVAGEELGTSRCEGMTGDRSPRSLGQYVGTGHGPQIADQPVEAAITHLDAIDVDDRVDEADRNQQCRERWAVDRRMEPGRDTAIDPIGRNHCGAKAWQTVSADDRSNQISARAKYVAQRERRGLDVVGRPKITDRHA